MWLVVEWLLGVVGEKVKWLVGRLDAVVET
jgi:hypothetical protein